MSWLWDVILPSRLETLLSKELTALASALVGNKSAIAWEAVKASKATLSVTEAQLEPVHLLGVFLLLEVSIQRFGNALSFSAGSVLLKITLPLFATSWDVSSKLLDKATKLVDWDVTVSSTASTLLVKELTADESALVVKTWLLASALANASAATLSVTVTHSTPSHLLGVLLLSLVSTHKFWASLSTSEGSFSE